MADQITPRPKTQREIFLDTPGQQPYVYPDGTVNENPNLADGRNNRGNHISFRDDNTKPFSLGLKENDEAKPNISRY